MAETYDSSTRRRQIGYTNYMSNYSIRRPRIANRMLHPHDGLLTDISEHLVRAQAETNRRNEEALKKAMHEQWLAELTPEQRKIWDEAQEGKQ